MSLSIFEMITYRRFNQFSMIRKLQKDTNFLVVARNEMTKQPKNNIFNGLFFI